jgi:hypothetical protein
VGLGWDPWDHQQVLLPEALGMILLPRAVTPIKLDTMDSVFVFCNEIPQIDLLKITIYCLIVPEARNLKSRCGRSGLLLKGLGKELSSPLPASGGFRCAWPVHAFLQERSSRGLQLTRTTVL